MTFHEINSTYAKAYRIIFNSISDYAKQITNLQLGLRSVANTILSSTLEGNIQKSLGEYQNQFTNIVYNYCNKLNLLEFHKILIEAKKEVEDLNVTGSKAFIEPIIEYLDIIEKYQSALFSYISRKSVGSLYELYLLGDTLLENQKEIDSILITLDSISNTVQDNFILTDDTELLTLQLYNSSSEYGEIVDCIVAIKTSYDCLAYLYTKGNSKKLDVVKIETGSLLEILLGDKNIIGLLVHLFTIIIDTIYKKFTFEGKLARISDLQEILLSDAELMQKYAAAGITMDNNEELRQTHAMVIKSVQSLLVKTTKIKINDTTLNIEDTVKDKYLLNSVKLLTNSSESSEDESDKAQSAPQ